MDSSGSPVETGLNLLHTILQECLQFTKEESTDGETNNDGSEPENAGVAVKTENAGPSVQPENTGNSVDVGAKYEDMAINNAASSLEQESVESADASENAEVVKTEDHGEQNIRKNGNDLDTKRKSEEQLASNIDKVHFNRSYFKIDSILF